MLVWGGGVAGGTYTNTGGRYDPSSDSWLPISTVGAPVSRTGFACVWAGDRMVIWGGSGSDTNEAERYDPATDSWSPGTLIGAPLRRDRPAAVSTGQELLFWSGNEFDTNNGYVQSGSRYNVPGDSWSTISLAGVPPNIGWAPATWAGDSMYLWNGGAMIGGRYCACTNATYYSDADGDGYGDAGSAVSYCSQPAGYVANPGDCNDTDPGSWQTPSEATDLMGLDAMSFAWQAPISPGGSQVLYDVIRSSNRSDYVTAADCIATDTSNLSASDPQLPPPGGIFYYLVRAQSGCVPGEGSLGTDSSGTPRTARHCP
jgi:hypothetical protein